MKRLRLVLVTALFLVVLGSAIAVYADAGDLPAADDLFGLGDPLGPGGPSDQGQGNHPHRPRGLRGEVTAINDAGLTVLTRNEVSVQVNVDENTKVWLVETQSQGNLADIEVGDRVFVQGRRAENDDTPAIDARRIVVAPDGDQVRGRVTAVEGSAITLATRQPDNPEVAFTVLTDENTEFRVRQRRGGWEQGSLEDVSVGNGLVAFGESLPDDRLSARLVFVDNRPPPPPPIHNVRGEVTAVSATGLTILARNGMSVQVNVDEDTKISLVETQSQGALQDIAVGDRVLVRGTRAGDRNIPEIDARHIVVAPDGDEVHGRVTAVEENTITLATRQPAEQEGEATIVTDEDTVFRVRARRGEWREGSLDDVSEGRFVVAFGETQPDGSLQARLVHVHLEQRNRPPGPPAGPSGGPGGDQLPDMRLGSHPDELPEDVWESAL